ncbi:ABC transporter permease [Nocardioides sp. LHG3406-4]|uniref:ABC transporter permease n=1 Tax=Nocardioides sp. LHG3406-4 TaxID=2804575 RepID=UPI003CE92E9D
MSIPGAGEVMTTHSEDSVVEDATAPRESTTGRSPLRIAVGRLRQDTVAMVCLAIVAVFVLIAIFAGVIAGFFDVALGPGNPAQQLDFLGDGMPLKGPPNYSFDPEHPFGVAPKTAVDNLAYWLYGCRTSLTIASTATLFATLIGVVMGLVAGFAGGVLDKVISFVTDLFLTLPFLLMALVIAPIINSRFADDPAYPTLQKWSLVAILVMFGWMGVCRLVRGETMSLREREFIQASRVIGMPTRRILFKELLPNLVAPIVVAVSLMLPAFIAAEAGLAFLGVGVTQGASWGQTILQASPYFEKYPLYLWEPLLGIVILVVALNLLGDAIRDAVDPKTRR